ncbi:hypothetical protein [Marilutibacter chinensis]|uniref:Uncharacterized protein n=1 Tax=Marilutibacter chinensis TaxID=2912247 RepID=A0ABS9HR36_9GAMM|nr:hypothetical protein [Lysobacter chinensis]MCF7220758.1 hypothetical protein [Lysobacter chinensis]
MRITNACAAGLIAALGMGMFAVPAVSGTRSAEQSEQDALWNFVATLSSSVERGGQTVIDTWPVADLEVKQRDSGRVDATGGSFVIGGRLRVDAADIRIRESGQVGILIAELGGACVSHEDVLRQYPDATRSAVPSPGDPNPHHYLEIQQNKLKVSFGFPDRGPDCMARVVFSPAPEPATE